MAALLGTISLHYQRHNYFISFHQ